MALAASLGCKSSKSITFAGDVPGSQCNFTLVHRFGDERPQSIHYLSIQMLRHTLIQHRVALSSGQKAGWLVGQALKGQS